MATRPTFIQNLKQLLRGAVVYNLCLIAVIFFMSVFFGKPLNIENTIASLVVFNTVHLIAFLLLIFFEHVAYEKFSYFWSMIRSYGRPLVDESFEKTYRTYHRHNAFLTCMLVVALAYFWGEFILFGGIPGIILIETLFLVGMLLVFEFKEAYNSYKEYIL